MSPISQIEFERILADPSAHYITPEDVACDHRLSRAQKISVLKQWSYDVREMEVAQEENMMPNDSDELILHQILIVLHQVEQS